MGKLKFTLQNIFFWISLVASCLLLENVTFLSSNVNGGLNDTVFFLLLSLCFIGYGYFYVVEHIKNRTSVDWVLISILSTAFIFGIIPILSFNGMSFTSSDPAFNFSYYIGGWEKIKQCAALFIFLVSCYSLLFVINKNHPSIRKISIIFIIVMAICYISIIYSVAAEFKLYSAIFKSVETNEEMESLFWNPNMFAGCLVMGIASSMGLNFYKKNVFSYISIPLFFIFIVFIGSLTSIIIALAGLLVYFLIEIIFEIKKNQRKGILLLALYLVVSVTLFIIFACALQYNFGAFSTFCKNLQHKIMDADYHTFTNRTFLWDGSISLLKDHPLNFIFGFGFRNSNIILGGYKQAYMKVESGPITSHSGYMQVLMNFGVFGAFIYAGFILYWLYSFIRLLRKNTRFAFIYFVIGAIFLVYSSMESVIFYNPNTQGIVIGTLFFLPMINRFKHLKKTEIADEILSKEKSTTLDPDVVTRTAARVFMSLIITAVSLYAFSSFKEIGVYRFLLLNIIVVLLMYLIFLPFVISCQSMNKSRVKFIISLITNLVIINAVFIVVMVNYYLNPAVSKSAKWVYPVLLAIVLVGETLFCLIFKGRKFKEYLETFVGAFKLSILGMVGTSLFAVLIFILKDKIQVSKLASIVYCTIGLELFYIFSLFIPFEDNKIVLNRFNSLAIYSLKTDTIKDRMEAHNEK